MRPRARRSLTLSVGVLAVAGSAEFFLVVSHRFKKPAPLATEPTTTTPSASSPPEARPPAPFERASLREQFVGPEIDAFVNSRANGRDSNGPLRGIKHDVWEGGTRIPFVVRWPGQVAAPGTASDELVWQGDIFATVAAYLGADLPADVAPLPQPSARTAKAVRAARFHRGRFPIRPPRRHHDRRLEAD
jgi:hypothetical protein